VPSPTPELRNLLARAQFFRLARQLNGWAVKMGKPSLSLLWEAARGFFVPALTGVTIDMDQAPWFLPSFVRRNRAALCGYPSRMKLLGPLPSFQENIAALNVLRRLVANCVPHPEHLREIRFPYLDRDFLEFLIGVPREQIVGVGKRRFLMKRALVGIVPDELLNRRRKGFVPEKNKKDSPTEWPSLVQLGQHIVCSSLEIIDSHQFSEVSHRASHNEDVPLRILRRILTIEFWLRHLTVYGVLAKSMSTTRQGSSLALDAKEFSARSAEKFS